MKKFITFLTILLFFVIGCKKEFLNPIDQNDLNLDHFYQDENQLNLMINGAYRILNQNGGGSDWADSYGLYGAKMWVFADAAADLLDANNFQGSGENPLSIQRGLQTPGISPVENIWWWSYQCIRRTNDILPNIPAIPGLSTAIQNKYSGELKFLRALSYFNLIRVVGGRPHVANEDQYGVPLITQAITSLQDTFFRSRATVNAIYGQIINDLKFAGQNLPKSWDASNLGRATKGAAYGLLAKVYMTKAGTTGDVATWTIASNYCDSVMNLGYALWSNPGALNNAYATLFRHDGENGSESLFELEMSKKIYYGLGESYNNLLALNWDMMSNPKGNCFPTKEFVAMYDTANDLRFKASIFKKGDIFIPDFSSSPMQSGGKVWHYDPSQTRTTTGYNVKKYLSGQATPPGGQTMWENGPANIRILRYADVLLIKAEAANELGALTGTIKTNTVDAIRARAGLVPLALLPKDQMRQAIWNERALELFMEADRWFDLKRTDRLQINMASINNNLPASQTDPTHTSAQFAPNFTSSARCYIMPLPQGDIDLSKGLLIQAPGY